MQSHFLHSGHSNKRFGLSRGSYVLSRRMALRTLICFLNVLKSYFVQVDEPMIQGVERPYKLIIYNLFIEKSCLDEIA
jgi:hypothetical protein